LLLPVVEQEDMVMEVVVELEDLEPIFQDIH
jgi:hypothetical protein